jgi:lipopolysaccharide biosynthesis glycosyltransferase
MPLATTMRSVVDSDRSGRPLEFHVLTDRVTENTQRKIHDSLPDGSASIRWLDVDLELFRDFSTISYVSKVTYARFLISRLFPETISKALYLDADLLVLDDLTALWETDLEENVLGAVLDGLDSQLKERTVRLAVPRVRDYFNGGVLLIDLHRWRSERISEKAMEYLTRHPKSPFSDQDALNVACDGRWKKLDPRWNFLAYNEKLNISDLKGEHRPIIVHFTTWRKPWRASTQNANATLYDSFRSRTCFARTPTDRIADMLRSVRSRFRNLRCFLKHCA